MKINPLPKLALSYESWSRYLAATTLLLVLVAPAIHNGLQERTQDPKSALGLTLGFISLGLIYFAGFYSVRRARLWLKMGRMESWLSLHTYLGVLSVLAVFLHSDWRFHPGAATTALILLVLVTISGAVGWAIYHFIPGRISSEAEEILTPEEIYHQMEKIQEQIDKLERRKSKQEGEKALETGREMKELSEKLGPLHEKLKHEFRQEAALGTWLYFHIPLSAALIVVASVHAFMIYYL